MTTHDESIKIILEKADHVATDMLNLLKEQLQELGISEAEMIAALQFAISTKMVEKAKNNLPK